MSGFQTFRFVFIGFCLLIIGGSIGRFFLILLSRPELYPSGDQIIWIKEVLLPFGSKEIGFFKAISYEYSTLSHSHIPQLAWLLSNEKWFGLDLRTDMWIGFYAAFCSFAIILRFTVKSIGLNPIAWSGMAAVSTILFSTGNGSMFSWSILLFQFVGFLIALIYLYKFSDLYRQSFWKLTLATGSVLLLSGPIGTAAVVASVITGLICSVSKKISFKVWVLHSLSFCFWVFLFGVIFQGGRIHSSIGYGDFFHYIVVNPKEFILGGLNTLAQMFIHERGSKPPSYFPFMPSYLIGITLSIVMICLSAFASFETFKFSKRPVTFFMFPCLIILTGLIVIAGTLKSRLPVRGVEYLLAPRYFTSFSIAGIGMILLLVMWAIDRKNRWSSGAVISLMMIVVTFNWSSSSSTFENMQYTDRYIAVRVDAMSNWRQIGMADLQLTLGGPCRNKELCSDVLEYLEENELSVFREKAGRVNESLLKN